MKRFAYVFVAFAALSLTACAHHRDVRAGADGINRVIVRGPEQEPLERSALSQANHYCEKRNLAPVFLQEEAQYTGSMNEGTHKALRTASKAASVVGASLGVFGGKNEQTAGAVVAGGGLIGGVVTGGNAYTVDMRFRCQ